jgi:hypothetical protein
MIFWTATYLHWYAVNLHVNIQHDLKYYSLDFIMKNNKSISIKIQKVKNHIYHSCKTFRIMLECSFPIFINSFL